MRPDILDAVRRDPGNLLCSVTVVRVTQRRHLVGALRHWRRVRREMRGLAYPPIVTRMKVDLRAGTVTFVTLWPHVRSVLMFNGLHTHVEAVRWVIRGGHRTWTGMLATVGLSSLSVPDGEPDWLAAVPMARPDLSPARPEAG